MKKFLLLAFWLALAAPVWAALQVEVGTCLANTASVTTTCVTGFQGKAVILWTDTQTAHGEIAGALFSIGLADNAAHVGTIAWSGDDAVATTNAGNSAYSNRALQINSNGTPTQVTRVSAVAFNAAPNMVLTWSTQPVSAWIIHYILLGGTDITNVFVGKHTIVVAAGAQSITGVGFQGNWVMIIGARRQDASGAGAGASIGMAVSAAKQWAWTGTVQDGQVASASVNGMANLHSDACLISQVSSTNTDDYVADFTAFTADGFDVNFSNAAPALQDIYYLVIKGGQWDAGVQAKPATATTQTIVTAFQPKLLGMLLSSPIAVSTYTSNSISTFGATDGTNQGYAGGYHNDAINTVAYSASSATALSHEIQATANATFNAFDPTDAKVDWSANGTAFLTAWFAAGDNAAAGGGKRRVIVTE
jgi:hypothetical protein